MRNNQQKLGVALARALATRTVPKENIQMAAEKLAAINPTIRRLDICAFGFCGDWWLTPDELQTDIQELVNIDGAELGEIRIFKYGIIDPDLFHVQAELHMDGLEGEIGIPG